MLRVRGAVRDSQKRQRHATRAVRYLSGQVAGAIEMMTPSGANSTSAPIRFGISSANADQAKPLLRFGGWISVAQNWTVFLKNGTVFWWSRFEYHNPNFFVFGGALQGRPKVQAARPRLGAAS